MYNASISYSDNPDRFHPNFVRLPLSSCVFNWFISLMLQICLITDDYNRHLTWLLPKLSAKLHIEHWYSDLNMQIVIANAVQNT
jgi:hypothetical protein